MEDEIICRICHGSAKRGGTPILRSGGEKSKMPKVTEVTVIGMLWAKIQQVFTEWQSYDKDGDEFIVPCACSGTMKHVHRACLDVWRKGSPRRDSFHRCEQCHQDYRFHTPLWGKVLAHPVSLFISSVVIYGAMLAIFFVLAHAIMAIIEPIGPHSGYEYVEIRARPLENGHFDYIEWYPSTMDNTSTTFYAVAENETEEGIVWLTPHVPTLATALYMICIFDFIVLNISWLGVFLLMMGMIRLHYFHSVLFDQIMLVALGVIALIRTWLAVRDQTYHAIARFVRIRLSRVQDTIDK